MAGARGPSKKERAAEKDAAAKDAAAKAKEDSEWAAAGIGDILTFVYCIRVVSRRIISLSGTPAHYLPSAFDSLDNSARATLIAGDGAMSKAQMKRAQQEQSKLQRQAARQVRDWGCKRKRTRTVTGARAPVPSLSSFTTYLLLLFCSRKTRTPPRLKWKN